MNWYSSAGSAAVKCSAPAAATAEVFYFQPGHETNPTYHHPVIQKIITNAVHWAKPLVRVSKLGCTNTPPVEEI